MTSRPEFRFLDPGRLVDGELSLELVRRIAPDPTKGRVAGYDFQMHSTRTGEPMGGISFRAEDHPLIELYRGHIGYNVNPDHRGHHYAERATRLLFPFIRNHGFSTIWITCNPDNLPSRRTCERLGAVFVEIVPVPQTEEMYARGEQEKRRYRLDL